MKLTYNYINKYLNDDLSLLIAKKVYENRLKNINIKKNVFKYWYKKTNILKINSFINKILFNESNYIYDDNDDETNIQLYETNIYFVIDDN